MDAQGWEALGTMIMAVAAVLALFRTAPPGQ